MQDISNYDKIREDTHNFYQKIRAVRCPVLNNELVHFNAEGFNHLIYKGKRRERNKNNQITKFKLLPKARTIIEISTTYQEYDESLTTVRKKRFKKIVEETTTVKYWGFVAIIQNFRTKVIVRQIGNGQKHFWSVIPAWMTSHYKNIKFISQAKGNLKED
ncbi:hypothetical protein KKA27_02705 [Patescibacteria group bacterium]|nr:hypothetical protein [Patescibacteria group bacterium]MBU2633385.1 hypothetical protein [Patescibacteria group bacterium]